MKNCLTTLIAATVISGCASTPPVSFEEIQAANAPFKRDMPELITYELKPMGAWKCVDENGVEAFCLTRDALIMVQDDRKNLLKMFDLKQREVQNMVSAYNAAIDAQTSMQTSLAYTEYRAMKLEATLERERNRSLWEKWGERLLFIGGVAAFGFLP